MACPHLAGVVANILEANPQLGPEEVKSIIERTATPLSTYDQFEAGTGLANVHAAVDLAYNPQKRYGDFGFTGKGLTLNQQDGGVFEGSVAAQATDSKMFSIPANTRFTFVQLDWEGSMGEDEVVIDNTRIVMNDLALNVSGNGVNQTSDELNLAALFGARECLKLEFPPAGTYTATVSAGFGFLQPTDQPYKITVTHYTYNPAEVADVSALDATAQAGALRLVYDRVMSASGGAFRPADTLTRMELARALMFAARVPQYIPNQPAFIDLPANTPDALVAESLKREGVMGVTGTMFGPAAEARTLANTTVTSGGQPLLDNAQIPEALRGYVQIAIDRGLIEAFPGPRFDPATKVKRADFIAPAVKVINIMFGE
jgi:serine protease AprX